MVKEPRGAGILSETDQPYRKDEERASVDLGVLWSSGVKDEGRPVC